MITSTILNRKSIRRVVSHAYESRRFETYRERASSIGAAQEPRYTRYLESRTLYYCKINTLKEKKIDIIHRYIYNITYQNIRYQNIILDSPSCLYSSDEYITISIYSYIVKKVCKIARTINVKIMQ